MAQPQEIIVFYKLRHIASSGLRTQPLSFEQTYKAVCLPGGSFSNFKNYLCILPATSRSSSHCLKRNHGNKLWHLHFSTMFHRDLPIRLHHEPSQRKLGREPTAKFGKFLMLPKELQLLIWEWFEVVNLRVRHTFISIHPENFEYFDLSQTSFAKHVWSANRNFEDHETYPGLDARRPRSLIGFIDSAVARRYEVPLLRDSKWAPEYYGSLSQFDRPYDRFRRYAPTWMNFKVDSFFFMPALHVWSGVSRRHGPIRSVQPTAFFHCFRHDEQFKAPQTSLSDLKKTHWFWSIQNLELFIAKLNTHLDDRERHVLGIHPALKSVKLLVTRTSLNCTHKTEDAYVDDGNGYNRRVFHELKHDNRGLSDDLSAVLAQWNTPPHNICECGQPRSFLRELLELRDDVCKLVKDRGVSVEIVAAGCDDPATIPEFKEWYII